MNHRPKVSVIIPTYNREDLLRDAVRSVKAQTLEDWECIVVDDGSTDGTKIFMEDAVKNDARMRYAYQENAGQAAARNKGIELAAGEYLAFLDSDDVYLPENLKRKTEFLAAHPDVRMVNGPSWIVEKGTGTCIDCAAYAPTNWVATREYMDAAGGFVPAQRNVEDQGVRIRAANAFGDPSVEYMMPEPLSVYFIHGAQVTNAPNRNPAVFSKRLETLLGDLDPGKEGPYRTFAPNIFSHLANFYILEGRVAEGRSWFRRSLRVKFSVFAALLLAVSYGGAGIYGNTERFLRAVQRKVVGRVRVARARRRFAESWAASRRVL